MTDSSSTGLNTLLVERGASTPAHPRKRLVHDLFREQAQRCPDNIAVIFGSDELSYGELDSRSAKLAHHLKSLGVGMESKVGICLERSVDLIVAIFGIWKAGGAYVPLDSDYPDERIGFICVDAGISILIAPGSMERRLQSNNIIKVVDLYRDADIIATWPHENPLVEMCPEHLAYVIYTSGSTGIPKGVLIEHQGLAYILDAMRICLGTQGKTLRISANSAFIFDAFVIQLVHIADGHTIVISSENERRSPPLLKALVIDKSIDVVDFTPAVLGLLMEEQDVSWLAHRTIWSGGDVLSLKIKERIAALKDVRFFNLYGPTECSAVATGGLMKADGVAPSIGRPMPGVQLYVLSSEMIPVPAGEVGELYIAGAGVARGYVNCSGLNSEYFLPNPFALPGARMYRTGDQVRWRTDGDLEFIGRVDRQVKVQGYRIELGEVESALLRHDGVLQASVIAHGNVHEEKRIVAFVVCRQRLGSAALRDALKLHIPSYMLPSTYVELDSLPLTSSGKVDRKALPVPTMRPELSVIYTAPRTPLEETFAEIWAQVLKVDRVGVCDNFFELGGNSFDLQLVRSKISRVAGINIAIREIYKNQDIASLTSSIDSGGLGEKQKMWFE